MIAIITDNTHKYNERLGLSAKLVRKVTQTVHNFETGIITATNKVYAQTFDEDNNEVLVFVPHLSNLSTYLKVEADGLFTALGTDISHNGSFTDQYNNLILQALIIETTQNQMFSNDTVSIYNP